MDITPDPAQYVGIHGRVSDFIARGRLHMVKFDAALAQQILVTPGQMFSNSLRFDPYLRINCGWPHQQDVEQGLRRLGQIVTELLEVKA